MTNKNCRDGVIHKSTISDYRMAVSINSSYFDVTGQNIVSFHERKQ